MKASIYSLQIILVILLVAACSPLPPVPPSPTPSFGMRNVIPPGLTPTVGCIALKEMDGGSTSGNTPATLGPLTAAAMAVGVHCFQHSWPITFSAASIRTWLLTWAANYPNDPIYVSLKIHRIAGAASYDSLCTINSTGVNSGFYGDIDCSGGPTVFINTIPASPTCPGIAWPNYTSPTWLANVEGMLATHGSTWGNLSIVAGITAADGIDDESVWGKNRNVPGIGTCSYLTYLDSLYDINGVYYGTVVPALRDHYKAAFPGKIVYMQSAAAINQYVREAIIAPAGTPVINYHPDSMGSDGGGTNWTTDSNGGQLQVGYAYGNSINWGGEPKADGGDDGGEQCTWFWILGDAYRMSMIDVQPSWMTANCLNAAGGLTYIESRLGTSAGVMASVDSVRITKYNKQYQDIPSIHSEDFPMNAEDGLYIYPGSSDTGLHKYCLASPGSLLDHSCLDSDWQTAVPNSTAQAQPLSRHLGENISWNLGVDHGWHWWQNNVSFTINVTALQNNSHIDVACKDSSGTTHSATITTTGSGHMATQSVTLVCYFNAQMTSGSDLEITTSSGTSLVDQVEIVAPAGVTPTPGTPAVTNTRTPAGSTATPGPTSTPRPSNTSTSTRVPIPSPTGTSVPTGTPTPLAKPLVNEVFNGCCDNNHDGVVTSADDGAEIYNGTGSTYIAAGCQLINNGTPSANMPTQTYVQPHGWLGIRTEQLGGFSISSSGGSLVLNCPVDPSASTPVYATVDALSYPNQATLGARSFGRLTDGNATVGILSTPSFARSNRP